MSSNHPPSQPGFDFGGALKWAWARFQANAATLIVAFVAIVAAVVAVALAAVALAAVTGSAFAFTLLVTLAVTAVGYLLGSGYVRALLAIADGQRPSIGEALTPYDPPRTIVYAVIVGVLSAVIAAVGSLLPVFGDLLANGASLVIGVLLSFGLYFLVERGLEPLDAIKASVDLVVRNPGPAILIYVTAVLAAVAGLLACCVGIVVGVPVSGLIYTYGYRQLTGRGVAG